MMNIPELQEKFDGCALLLKDTGCVLMQSGKEFEAWEVLKKALEWAPVKHNKEIAKAIP